MDKKILDGLEIILSSTNALQGLRFKNYMLCFV